MIHEALFISILKGFKAALRNPTRSIVDSVQIPVGSHALNRFWFELVTLSKNKFENMSLQIAVTAQGTRVVPWQARGCSTLAYEPLMQQATSPNQVSNCPYSQAGNQHPRMRTI